jgi:hypothetical protein
LGGDPRQSEGDQQHCRQPAGEYFLSVPHTYISVDTDRAPAQDVKNELAAVSAGAYRSSPSWYFTFLQGERLEVLVVSVTDL